MNTVVTRHVTTIEDALSAHPEWWVVAGGACSWLWVLQHGIAQWGHGVHHHVSLGAELLDWHLMVMAMMLPTITRQARAIALRSFAAQRSRAIAAFLVGYLAPWSAFGVAAVAIRTLAWGRASWIVPALCAVAALWAILPLRERAMMMVHGFAPAIAPDGWPFVRDCVASGLTVASYCVASCWPLMLACALSGHDLAVIAAGGLIGLVEFRSFYHPTRFLTAVPATLAVFFTLR